MSERSKVGRTALAGIDEAGRGPLAGPVVAAAVVLDSGRPIKGLNDSKQLSESMRNQLYHAITANAQSYGIAVASPEEIDAINILQASLLAMQRAFQQLNTHVDEAWIDGKQAPDLPCPTHTLVQGDAKMPVIGAASILAKVTRDAMMVEYSKKYPRYGFERHKGYPTPLHLAKLQEYGPCAIHRRTYGPVIAATHKLTGLPA